jgi:hypothetical protein
MSTHAVHAAAPENFDLVWNAAFLNAVNGAGLMTDDDFALARRLRENGRPPAYAAARVRLRIRNRMHAAA